MKVIEWKEHNGRYIIVSDDEKQVLDNAQGYGYTSKQKAHAAWSYKNRSKSKIKQDKERKKRIQSWIKEHKEFMNNLESELFYAMKDGEEIDNKTIQKWMKQEDPNIDFTAHQLMKEW